MNSWSPLKSPVTVGVGAQTTVPIPDNGIPEGFPEACVLVSPQDGVPVLHVHPGMTGRLVWPGHTVDLDHLGDAVPATLPLRPGVRGKVRIGPTTILLQLVPAPAVQTLPPLQFRPQLLDPDDPLFLGLLSGWSAAAAVLLAWVSTQGPVGPVTLADLPQDTVRIYLQAPPEPPPSEPTPPPEPEPNPESTPVTKTVDAEPPAAAPSPSHKQVIRQSSLLSALSSGNTTASEIFGAGTGLEGIAQTLDRSTTVDEGGRVGGVRHGTGTILIDGRVDPLARQHVHDARVQRVRTTARQPTVTGVPETQGTVDQTLLTAIRRQLPKLKRCYEQRLLIYPELAGRVALDMEVINGKVVDAVVTDNTTRDPKLAECITSRARRFALPEGVDGALLLPLIFEPG